MPKQISRARVWITSLNSHFPLRELSTRCWEEKKRSQGLRIFQA